MRTNNERVEDEIDELETEIKRLRKQHAKLVEAARGLVIFVDGLGRYEIQNIPMLRKHVEALRECVEGDQ